MAPKGRRIVLTEGVNGSNDSGDENEAEPEKGDVGTVECGDGTGLAVWLWSSSAAFLRQVQLGMRPTLTCRGTTLRS